MLDNHRAKLGHAFAKPRRYTASLEREIGSAGTLHASILIANDDREKQNSRKADSRKLDTIYFPDRSWRIAWACSGTYMGRAGGLMLHDLRD
jgi:hypothetical protein